MAVRAVIYIFQINRLRAENPSKRIWYEDSFTVTENRSSTQIQIPYENVNLAKNSFQLKASEFCVLWLPVPVALRQLHFTQWQEID